MPSILDTCPEIALQKIITQIRVLQQVRCTLYVITSACVANPRQALIGAHSTLAALSTEDGKLFQTRFLPATLKTFNRLRRGMRY